MGPGPPSWGLGMGLTTPHCKKLPVRKPEIWHWKDLVRTGMSSQGIEGYGGGPLWRQRPTLCCNANVEEECHHSFTIYLYHSFGFIR